MCMHVMQMFAVKIEAQVPKQHRSSMFEANSNVDTFECKKTKSLPTLLTLKPGCTKPKWVTLQCSVNILV